MRFAQLVRFLLPLAITAVVSGLSSQVINGGMARMPQATETLAAFGLASGLIMLLASPLTQVKQLGLVLVDGRQAYRRVLSFVIISGLLLALTVSVLALGRPGDWVIEGLHGVSGQLAKLVRLVLLWFIPVPLLKGVTLFYGGVLLNKRRSDLVGLGTLASIAAGIVTVFALLPASFVAARPILLPILASYAGMLVEFAVVLWGFQRHARLELAVDSQTLTLAYVLRFFWPLALIMVIQGFSRPLINLFVSREPRGAESLAVLTVVYPLAHLFYGWLNEIRNLPSAFKGWGDNLSIILRFSVACGLFSFASMLLFLWTPARDVILQRLIGVGPDLAAEARLPLFVFSFFPLAVMFRAFLHGVGLRSHRTAAMAPSAPFRILAILLMLLLLPAVGLSGATRGVASLLAGFLVETLVVWWGIRGRSRPMVISSTGKIAG